MKLLFDQNLSPRLVNTFLSEFPGSTHTSILGLDRETDTNLWNFAKDKDFTIVSKDSDFVELATINGPPPKVIWLNIGNSSTKQVSAVIKNHLSDIKRFIQTTDLDILQIG